MSLRVSARTDTFRTCLSFSLFRSKLRYDNLNPLDSLAFRRLSGGGVVACDILGDS